MTNPQRGQRHVLAPLLNPRSVALVGVSARPGSIGRWLLDTFLGGGYPGELFLVNPRYPELDGHRCYADLSELPTLPEMAVLNVGSARMEELFDQAVALGIRALTLFDYCVLEQEETPPLLSRLREKASRHGVAICGGGGMGFYNLDAGVHASYYSAEHLTPGHIALIAHSGSVFTVLAMADPRHRFNLVVSAGSEIVTGVDAYLDYAICQPSTRVVALFIETVRNPAAFERALAEAQARDIPVVICKVGRTAKSAEFARTHSGAIAGSYAAFEALCDRYGALTVDNLDEMMATAALFAQGRRARSGGIGAVLDSGGLRQLLVDRAERLGLSFAKLSSTTLAHIAEHLPHTLEADNPLDAAGPVTDDYEAAFREGLGAIMSDPDTGLGWFEFDATDHFRPMPGYLDVAKEAAAATDKPLLVVNSASSTINTQVAAELHADGVTLINGVDAGLVAVRNLFEHRDHGLRGPRVVPTLPADTLVTHWRDRLANGALSETEALELLAAFHIPTVPCRAAADLDEALNAAEALGFPVALKTAAPGQDHKTDVDGVRLGIADRDALQDAYRDLDRRLGPQVTVAAMAPSGIEVAFGMVRDDQFGPLVMVSAGGTLIELLADRATMLPRFDHREARRHIERLAIHRLLMGVRGAAPADVDALAEALSKFSILVAALGDSVAEIDVNPLLAGPDGVMAVDALVVSRVAPS